MIDHTAVAHLDDPIRRALRDDYDAADAEVQDLKLQLSVYRMLFGPISPGLWKPLRSNTAGLV